MKRYGVAVTMVAALLFTSGGLVPQALAAESTTTTSVSNLSMNLTGKEAQELAGFTVKLPGLPKGYRLDNLAFNRTTGNVVATLAGNNHKPFYMEMKKGDITKESAGMEVIKYKEGTAYQGKKEGFGDMTVILWEEEPGLIYQLASGLPDYELAYIAESVGTSTELDEIRQSEEYGQIFSDLTVEEASEMFGSPLKVPQLPSGMEWAIAFSVPDESVIIHNKIAGKVFVSINVCKMSYETIAKSDYMTDIKQVTVNGKAALTGKVPGYSFHEPDRVAWNSLVWEVSEGIVYAMNSNLDYEEMIKIAESVK